MPIQIRQAQRRGSRLVLGLAGTSGSGKTYTALQVGWGLAGYDASKLGMLDTENKRGSLYADSLVDHSTGECHRFFIGDLYPPFSPARYTDAIHEFQKAGVEVLVIDSVTHEWEGTGGCEEIANNTNSRIADWKGAKYEHKKFMNAMLQSDMHIIACIRAREKMDFTNPKAPKSLGIQPIQEKNFMFEMTASLMLWHEGRAQQILKCPDQLKHILGREQGYLTPADGAALRAWIAGEPTAQADDSSAKLDKWRNRLQSITDKGAAYLDDAWRQTPDAIRNALGTSFYATLRASAVAFDELREREPPDTDSSADDVNALLEQPTT